MASDIQKSTKPPDSMAPHEYEIMYRLEENYWWYVGIRAIARSIIEDFVPKGEGIQVLDAGCGTGGNFEFLGEFGRVTGIELSSEAAKFIRIRLVNNFVTGSVTDLPFADSSFDLVTVFYVNECLDDDGPAFNEYRRVLKPGGLLYFSEVAFESLRAEHDLAVGIVRRYTRADISERLLRAGFPIKRFTYGNALLFPPIFLLRRLREIFKPVSKPEEARSDFDLAPGLLHGIFKATLLIEARLMKFMNLPFGVSIMGIARKPLS